MKILRIKVSNLNSLRGDHEVDFEKAPLANVGLFAITGPTGAGKSTLLDAITLALYGRSARYGNTPSPEDVMSRHCGECSAEVEFRVASGVYRAVWQLRRSRNDPNGKMQAPKRYVYDAGGVPLTQNIREAEEKIEQLVGLDYPRFLRSVLLAQGEFAQFLKAKPDERADLLERLTGTSIYSELGILAHSEATRREQILFESEKEIERIVLLTDEQREGLKKDIALASSSFETTQVKLQKANELVNKSVNLAQALGREQQALHGKRDLEAARNAAKEDLQRLGRHRLTIPFHADLTRLESAEKELKAREDLLEQSKKGHGRVLLTVRRYLPAYRRLIQDLVLSVEKDIGDIKEKIEKTTQLKETADKWLGEHEPEKQLADKLASLVAGLTDLKNVRKSFGKSWAKLCIQAKALESGEAESFPQRVKDLDESSVKASLSRLNALAESKRTEAEQIKNDAKVELSHREDHLASVRLIASFEQHRTELKKGEPCPLCGSNEHPYITSTPPSTAFESLQRRVEEARKTLERRDTELNAIKQLDKELSANGEALLADIRQGFLSRQQLERELKVFGVAVPESGQEDEAGIELDKRAKAYVGWAQESENLRRDLLSMKTKISNLESHLKILRSKQNNLAKEVVPELTETMGELDISRFTQPDWQNAESAENDWNQAKHDLTVKTTALEHCQSDILRLKQEHSLLLASINSKLLGSDFAELETLKLAKLKTEESLRIEKIEADYKDRGLKLDTNLRTAQQEITDLRREGVPEGEEAVGKLKADRDELQRQRDQYIGDLRTWRNRLEQDDRDRKLTLEKQKALEELRKEVSAWKRLQALIGSHDGKKFRRYAQCLSLETLSRHANRHLVRLSDRYRLKTRAGEELELEIEDLHQAGVTRPMASLSGGESFLASLALALGLSQMAGKNVRIESLFIDEGFGTLDADSLDLAISTLESLRQDNKTVGVISHVHLLKERISTQIVVEKQSGGTSNIRVVD